jgi:hypothetical protein
MLGQVFFSVNSGDRSKKPYRLSLLWLCDLNLFVLSYSIRGFIILLFTLLSNFIMGIALKKTTSIDPHETQAILYTQGTTI